MNNVSKYFALAFLLMVFSNANAVEPTMVMGDVVLVRPNQKIAVNRSTVFVDGDIVETGNRSYLVLQTKRGDEITLQENSTLLIDKSLIEEGVFSLIAGKISAKIEKVKAEDEVKIYTPSSIAAVRGTEFDVIVSDSGAARVSMKNGTVEIYNSQGQQRVSGRQRAETVPGVSPQKDDNRMSDDEWNKSKNTNLRDNPRETSNNFEQHIVQISQDSEVADKLGKLEQSVNNVDKNNVASFENDLKDAETVLHDNYIMNRTCGIAVEKLADEFKQSQADIAAEFEKIKNQSDTVKQQQEKDIAAIREIREKYEQYKAEIFEKHDSMIDQIRDRTRINR